MEIVFLPMIRSRGVVSAQKRESRKRIKMNKNALNIGVMSRLLGDEIRNEEAGILDKTGFTR